MIRVTLLAIALTIPWASLHGLEIHRFDNGVSARIVKLDQHPFLVDHAKALQLRKGHQILEQIRLYGDHGGGAPAYLYAGDHPFVEITIVDCNGHWTRLNDKGEIKSHNWNWLADLPDTFIGEIKYINGNGYRLITRNTPPTPKEVYQFKDPK